MFVRTLFFKLWVPTLREFLNRCSGEVLLTNQLKKKKVILKVMSLTLIYL